jgi:protein phosphatase PTC1
MPQTTQPSIDYATFPSSPSTFLPLTESVPFSDSPNARSKTITTADGLETYGVCRLNFMIKYMELQHLQVLNRHAAQHSAYQVGVSEDMGARRTMEDAHSFVIDFAGIRGQGFFAVFDGHAGKHAAEWCGSHFHEVCSPLFAAN